MIIRKRDICEALGLANDWHAITDLLQKDYETGMKYVDERVNKVSALVKEWWDNTKRTEMIGKSSYSERAHNCFSSAIKNLTVEKYGDSLHEIHDVIFEFGNKLDTPINDVEYLLLMQWIELYKRIRSLSDQKKEGQHMDMKIDKNTEVISDNIN